MQIFAFKDKKGENFFNLFTAKNPAVATRVTKELTQNPGTPFFSNPEDYAVYFIGNINEDNGKLIPISEAVHVCECEDYKVEKK